MNIIVPRIDKELSGRGRERLHVGLLKASLEGPAATSFTEF